MARVVTENAHLFRSALACCPDAGQNDAIGLRETEILAAVALAMNFSDRDFRFPMPLPGAKSTFSFTARECLEDISYVLYPLQEQIIPLCRETANLAVAETMVLAEIVVTREGMDSDLAALRVGESSPLMHLATELRAMALGIGGAR